MLLIDFNVSDTVKVINESTKSGTMKVRGIFGRADEYNNNNRIYKKSILDREVKNLFPLIQERRLLGELDHPDYSSVKLTNVSHLVTGLYWDGNKLIGEAEILNTPAGKVAQQLIKDGVKIGISSRGLGTLKPVDESGKVEVQEDYKMVTFDLVADPSTKGAFPQLTESTQVKMKSTMAQAMAETIFLKLLENKLKPVDEGSLGLKRNERLLKRFEKKLNKDINTKGDLKDSDAALKVFKDNSMKVYKKSNVQKERHPSLRNKKSKQEESIQRIFNLYASINEGSMGQKRTARKIGSKKIDFSTAVKFHKKYSDKRGKRESIKNGNPALTQDRMKVKSKQEESIQRIFNIYEGLTTGSSAFHTGERVGKTLKKYHNPHHASGGQLLNKENQAKRIRSKISKREGKRKTSLGKNYPLGKIAYHEYERGLSKGARSKK